MTTQVHRTQHAIVARAGLDAAYRVVADVSAWPAVFGPTIHVHYLERGRSRERFRIWAVVNGEIRIWTSSRTLDRQRRSIEFAQDHANPPVASMGGRWEFRELCHNETEIVLHHHFTTVDDTPESLGWMHTALDRNSAAELSALRRALDSGYPPEDILFSFRDSVTANGSVADAYEFIHRAKEWPVRLPHVSRVKLTESEPGVQELEMDTTSVDGGTHTTKSLRVCLTDEVIAYKQTVLPGLLSGHSGRWSFRQLGTEVLLESEHTVLLAPDEVAGTLGPNATAADARAFIRRTLGHNSGVTLKHAKEFAEQRAAHPVTAKRRPG